MTPLKTFRIGTELEFNWPSRNTADSSSVLLSYGRVHLDGTVPQGFEISSKIFNSTDFIGASGIKTFSPLFDELTRLKVAPESPMGAGMHIHLERWGLSAEAISFIDAFIFNYQKQIQVIGGRSFTTYCKPRKNPTSMLINSMTKGASSIRPRGAKHQAFNICPIETVEFRFFKTTPLLTIFLKNVQFVIALASFALTKNAIEKDCLTGAAFSAFIKFCKSKKIHFPHLWEFLNFKKLNEEPAPIIPFKVKLSDIQNATRRIRIKQMVDAEKQRKGQILRLSIAPLEFIRLLPRAINPSRDVLTYNEALGIANRAINANAAVMVFED